MMMSDALNAAPPQDVDPCEDVRQIVTPLPDPPPQSVMIGGQEVSTLCQCSLQLDIIDEDVYTDVVSRVGSVMNRVAGCERDENCMFFGVDVLLRMLYTDFQSWTFSAGLTVAAEAQMRPGILSRAVIDGKVSLSAEVQVGGSYEKSDKYEYTRERRFHVPSCVGVAVWWQFNDYEAVVSQHRGLLYRCYVQTVDENGVVQEYTYECFDEVETGVATADGATKFAARFENYAPCDHDCEDQRVEQSKEAGPRAPEGVVEPPAQAGW